MQRATVDSGELVKHLKLKRLGDAAPAGLIVTSLPLPRGMPPDVQIVGRTTGRKKLGQWYKSQPGEDTPRRVLLFADGGSELPETLTIEKAGASSAVTLPEVTDPIFEQSQEPEVHWERRSLTISHQGRQIHLAMGMKYKGQTRWWEHSRLVKVAKHDTYLEVEMAGSIPTILFNQETLNTYQGYNFPGLHVHHWLSGHMYARVHSNGVCEIYAHHINSRFADDGRTLNDVVPTIGFRCTDAGSAGVPRGNWDGSANQWELDGVKVDFADASNMASAEQPGRIEHDGDFLIVQPYQGVSMFGGLCPIQLTGDPYIFRPEDQIFPHGMARTLRFSVSLNPQRSARIARYISPAWWYGMAAEFSPVPYLPVADELDKMTLSGQDFLRNHMIRKNFEDGSLPRGVSKPTAEKLGGRNEPGWEGEAAGIAFLLAYRTGSELDYDDAMRASYCFTDMYLDHATKLGRMHGYGPPALNVPMTRLHAPVYAWLETGDPYTLSTARALLDGAYWTHKNSWPRLAVGRDACFVRAAMLIYRFTNEQRALDIARDVCFDVAESQHPTGYFGDQGGGSGIHGWGGYICKPWMGLMAVGGLLDFLELEIEDQPRIRECVKKFADWLMVERFDHDGVMGWSYQHYFNDKRYYRFCQNGEAVTLPTKDQWHMDYLARLMTYATMQFGDPAYYHAWLESYRGYKSERKIGGDHSFAQSIQYLPWTQAMTWRATWKDGKVVADPMPLADAPKTGTIMGPDGPVPVSR